MQKALWDLALKRAGFASLEEFEARYGLTEATVGQALLPYLVGYTLHRVAAGDTLYSLARQYETEASAIGRANPGVVAENLRVGSILVVPLGFDLVPGSVPMTWELCHWILRGLGARYPGMGLDTIGRSVYGRPLEQVKFGSGPRVVYLNAAHHANEWITSTMLLAFLEQYMKAAVTGQQLWGQDAGRLSRETTLYAVPLVNPDGVDLVNGALTKAEEAAAAAIGVSYPDIPFPSGWKANLRGVDLNLNYPAGWDKAKEQKEALGFTGPAPRDYVGPEPVSEPETRAMFDATEYLRPDLTVAWHTQGREIYWKYLDLSPTGSRALGLQMAEASGYTLSEVPTASGYAGYKDWFIQDFQRPGYTVEAGLGENPLPLSQLPDLLRDNLPIFLLALSGGNPDFQEPDSALIPAADAVPVQNVPQHHRPRLNGNQSWG